MSNITEKGSLPIGFKVGDKLVREFTVRPLLLRDTVEAMELYDGDAPLSQVAARVAAEARAITFEGIENPVSLEVMLALTDTDYNEIAKKFSDAEKKMLTQNAS